MSVGGSAVTALRAIVVEGDDLTIPASLRDALGVKPGDAVLIETQGSELRIRPESTPIERLQAFLAPYAPKDGYASEKLIADRRAEAERD